MDINNLNGVHLTGVSSSETKKAANDAGVDFLFTVGTSATSGAQNIINTESLNNQMETLTLNHESLRRAGANSVTGLTMLAATKGKQVMDNISTVASGLMRQMNAVLADGSLSEEEKEDKIKTLQKKGQAAQKEAEAKLAILVMLSDSVFDVYKITLSLKQSNMGTSEITNFMAGMISGLDTSVSNYSNAKNPEDIEKMLGENMDKIYGPNSDDKLKEQEEDIKEKIEKLEEQLEKEDLSDEEKEKIKLQLEVYNFELRIVSFIRETIQEFLPEDEKE